MSVAQRITEAEYERIVLAAPDQQWELIEGRLREKPGKSWDHGRIVTLLGYLLMFQLDHREFLVLYESRVRREVGTIFLPDLMVVPTSYGRDFAGQPGVLAIFSDPLPLVVEVWSGSTGDYDVDTKIPEYQRRGDRELWRIHPYERTLTARRHQPDESYAETVYRTGIVAAESLPGVAVDLSELFGD